MPMPGMMPMMPPMGPRPGAMPGMPPGGPPPQPGMPPGSPQGGPVGALDPENIAGQLAALAMQMIKNPQVAQGMAFRHVLDTVPKLMKAEKTVPAMAPKMTATTPFQPPIGRADQAALGQMGAAQQAGMPPGGGMGPGSPSGGPPPEMLQQLAMSRMGGM